MPQAPSSHPTEGQNIRTTETWNNRTNRNNSKKITIYGKRTKMAISL
jgi:hypothetical protein